MNNILKFSIVLLIITFLFYPPAVFGDSADPTFKKSVVMVRAVKQDYDYRTPWKQSSMSSGVGSGFVIEDGLILTNAHNISNAKYVEVRKQDLAKRYIARVAFAGHDCDLAVLAIDDMSFYNDVVQLELGGIPAVNSTVQTYGFPMGGKQISVTEGVVSRIEMDVYAHPRADSHLVVQTDAAINPGNSGGPVIQNGKVVGVAFQGLSSGDNIGYMIPTTVIRHFIKDINDGEYDGFGSLGFSMFPGLHSDSYRDYLQVPDGEEGVVVLETMMHSSVEDMLKPEDVITSIDGHEIDNDGNIYFGDESGFFYVISPEGERVWRTTKLGTRVWSSVTIGDNGIIYVGADQEDETSLLYAIQTEATGPASTGWPMRAKNARHTGR